VQHEGIGISAQFSNDEGYPLRHQAGYKGHVARQSVELGYNYAALRSLCRGQRCGQLGAPVQGICALAGFSLDVFGHDGQGFPGGKALHGRALGFKA
jgi:hypothetical protein